MVDETDPPNQSSLSPSSEEQGGAAPLLSGLEWGGPPLSNSDPSTLVEANVKTTILKVEGHSPRGWRFLVHLVGSKTTAHLVIVMIALLVSVPLWEVSNVGGPVVTSLIFIMGLITRKKD